MDQPIRQNAQTLTSFLRHTNLSMFTLEYGPGGWHRQVHERLQTQWQDAIDIKTIAGKLDMHPHTLRQRLREEGASFKQLRDELRQREATKLLRDQSLSIEAIGMQLGYSETSAFSRACKRWTGTSPRSLRQYFFSKEP